MQAYPCANFLHDPAFQRAVGVGILAGVAGGAAGLGAGIALGFFIPGSTLVGAIVIGTFAGAVGGGATQITANTLTGQSLTDGLTRAVIVGAVTGGVGGAVGHGIERAWVGIRGSAPANNTVQATPKLVYRGGSDTPYNLTPRPGVDTTGLSTFDNLESAVKPGDKAQAIDVSKLKPPLRAAPDPEPPGHVSITPDDPALIEEWAATRGTGTVHPFTQNIIDAIIGSVRRPK
jgi:hypothetical protein